MNALASLVFIASCAFFLWVMAGYPLWLAAVAKRRARPVHKGDFQPSVAVVIPVKNGAAYIRRKLDSLLALEYPKELLDILIVSDGSTDRSEELVREYAAQGVRFISVPPGGKPAALNAAIPQTHGEIVLLTDIRQELEPQCLRLLLRNFADPEVGVTSGDLIIRQGDNLAESDIGLYRKFESWIRNQHTSLDSMFGAMGAFYAIRRELVVPIPNDTLLDDMYLPLAAFFRGYRLTMESAARVFDDPTSLSTEFRRKVRTLAGNYQIIQRYPALLTFRNRMWIHFISHKFGRLVLPFALLGIAFSSFWLPVRAIAIAALAAQAIVYGLAAFDYVSGFLPEKFVLRRLSSAARTFVVMMIAAICALSIFFVSPQKLWTPTKTRAGGTA